MPIEVKEMEFQAAEALLQLHYCAPSLFNGYGSIDLYQPIHLGQKETSDKGTQTDEKITDKDTLISMLNEEIQALRHQLKETRRRSPSPVAAKLNPDVSANVLQIQHHNQRNNAYKKRKSAMRSSSSRNTANDLDSDASDDEWRLKDHKTSEQIIHDTRKPKGNDMVHIGEGYASVPARLWRQMDWSSYTGATRKLLSAVFSRQQLATSSLTGKPSPAFPGKRAKERLDPKLVNDIVQVVVKHCRVPESVVRTSITTKCADESKMYRSRQQNKKKQQLSKMNQENVPPSP